MNREAVLIFSKPEEVAPLPGMFSRLVSMSSRMSISNRLSSRLKSEGRLSQLMGLSSKKSIHVEPVAPPVPVVRPAPAIISGMFGNETPDFLLAAPIERAIFGGANEQRMNTRHSAVTGHHAIMQAVKDKNNEKHARWKVDVPGITRKTSQSLATLKENDEDEDEDEESFGSEDNSVDDRRAPPISDFDDNAMNMIHAEVIR